MFGLKLDDIKVNGVPLNVCSKLDKGAQCLITIDSGSSANGVPSKALSAFSDAGLPVSTNFVECTEREAIGSLTYVINGKDYTLNADEWLNYREVNFAQDTTIEFGNGPLGPQMLVQLEKPAESSNIQVATIMPAEINEDESKQEEQANADNSEPTKKFCAARLNELDIEADMFLVGDIFMRKFYTVFDRDNDRVGIARSITKTSEMPDAPAMT